MGTSLVEIGIDLSEFYLSVEWDVLEVPAIRNEKYYTCCEGKKATVPLAITLLSQLLTSTHKLLSRALYRYNFQHQYETKNVVLHRQLDNSLVIIGLRIVLHFPSLL